MGFFDRLRGKSSSRPASSSPSSESEQTPPTPAEPASPVAPQLDAAREQLELRKLDEAKAIYEEILAAPGGDRPDVLVRISGDLGSTGHVATIIELIAPIYDAERHGPAAGMNLLQAYLAKQQPEAAQHVLDLLFALNRPELEDRLWGFSNAIGELMTVRRRAPTSAPGGEARHISLVSISKPIWAYGVGDLPGLLPAKDGAAKTIAFGQLAVPGMKDYEQRMTQPEDELGRFTRGFPLWLAETLYFSRQYTTLAAVGLTAQQHYALFPFPWATEHIRQLIDTAGQPLDYVMTGTLEEHDADYSLQLQLWEVKTFRERKTFTARWTPATATERLATLHEQIRFFFEWQAGAGLTYAAPADPVRWIHTLGASLSTFLVDKGVLPAAQLAPLPALAAGDVAASVAQLTLADRCQRVGAAAPVGGPLADDPLVQAARERLEA